MKKCFVRFGFRYLIQRETPCITYFEDTSDILNKEIITIMEKMSQIYPLVLCYKINWKETQKLDSYIKPTKSSDVVCFQFGKVLCSVSAYSEKALHNLFKTVLNDCISNYFSQLRHILKKEGHVFKNVKPEKLYIKYPSYNISREFNDEDSSPKELKSCEMPSKHRNKYMEICSKNLEKSDNNQKSKYLRKHSFDLNDKCLKNKYLNSNFIFSGCNNRVNIYPKKIEQNFYSSNAFSDTCFYSKINNNEQISNKFNVTQIESKKHSLGSINNDSVQINNINDNIYKNKANSLSYKNYFFNQKTNIFEDLNSESQIDYIKLPLGRNMNQKIINNTNNTTSNHYNTHIEEINNQSNTLLHYPFQKNILPLNQNLSNNNISKVLYYPGNNNFDTKTRKIEEIIPTTSNKKFRNDQKYYKKSSQ